MSGTRQLRVRLRRRQTQYRLPHRRRSWQQRHWLSGRPDFHTQSRQARRDWSDAQKFLRPAFSSQTRAALLTGRYPMRYGLQTMSILPSSKFGLPVEERTLAQGLREAGYRTAFIGKWQLGHARPDFWPTNRGFDYFYGTLSDEVHDRVGKNSGG